MPQTRQKKKYRPQHHLFKECEDHENHLCFLVANRKMDRVFALAKDSKVICQTCGRTAASGAHLCSPVKMEEE